MNAPRALPMVSGPVGLADTNSTLTARGRTGSTRPHASGSARMPSTSPARASGRRRRLMNPGGATAALSIGGRRRADAAWPRGASPARSAACGTAGPASWPGWWPGRRAPGRPVARPRSTAGPRPRARAAHRSRWRPPTRARWRRGPGGGWVPGSRCWHDLLRAAHRSGTTMAPTVLGPRGTGGDGMHQHPRRREVVRAGAVRSDVARGTGRVPVLPANHARTSPTVHGRLRGTHRRRRSTRIRPAGHRLGDPYRCIRHPRARTRLARKLVLACRRLPHHGRVFAPTATSAVLAADAVAPIANDQRPTTIAERRRATRRGRHGPVRWPTRSTGSPTERDGWPDRHQQRHRTTSFDWAMTAGGHARLRHGRVIVKAGDNALRVPLPDNPRRLGHEPRPRRTTTVGSRRTSSHVEFCFDQKRRPGPPTPTPTPTATPTATPDRDADRDADGHADRDADGHADRDADGHADRDADARRPPASSGSRPSG